MTRYSKGIEWLISVINVDFCLGSQLLLATRYFCTTKGNNAQQEDYASHADDKGWSHAIQSNDNGAQHATSAEYIGP